MALKAKYTEQVVIQTTLDVKEFIKTEADTLDLSQSEIGRQLLDLGIEAWKARNAR